MKLKELAAAIPKRLSPVLVGDGEQTIESLSYDSRQVFPGVGFICLKGANSDGHRFKSDAIKHGASAFVIDTERTDEFSGTEKPFISVINTRAALPYLAAAFYENPTRKFELIGVTGTNGKTTTTCMISAIWEAVGEKTGVVGTIGAFIDGVPFPTNWTVSTTPESLDLQQLFSQMAREGVKHAAVEVTSVAIDQERTSANSFDTAVFTNLTLDHLDYHGTMEAYEAAKARLFLEYPIKGDKDFLAVVNADDPAGLRLGQASKALGLRTIYFGINSSSVDYSAENIVAKANAITFKVVESSGAQYNVALPIGGLFNVSNALAAIAATRERGVTIDSVQSGFAHLRPISGRFEPVPTLGKDYHVLVDYAHTSDGLENVLVSALALSPKRLVVVFGCGGDRERTKRSKMGKIAADLADLVVVTSDNPRFEEPEFIISEILAGIEGGDQNKKVVVIVDRHAAIRYAICDAVLPGDLIVIAGKGHETYQIVKDKTLPFDDRLVAAEAIASCS